MFASIEKQLGPLHEVIRDRLSAFWLRLRGARLGPRTRVGRRLSVINPWCLSAGARCQFEHQVFIKATTDSARIALGDQVFVGFNTEFDISEQLIIGNHVLIAPGCFITDHGHRFDSAELIASQGCVNRPVCIEDDVWLGANVVVLPGVTIGRGAIVGAGAVVNRDVAAMSIVAGVPARAIGERAQTK
ncbi:MAG: acyltransferase [Pseudomonadota bacterium]|nr:acyltransferase [Pseudomonadota bacterium]